MCEVRKKRQLPETVQTEGGLYPPHEKTEQEDQKGSKDMKPQELSLQCEALEEFVMNLDEALKITAKAMMRKKMQCGTVNAKIDIVIQEVTNTDGEVFKVLSIKPGVSMKIGSKEKMETAERNGLYVKQDENGVPIVGSSQVSIDELISRQEATA